MKMRLNTFLIGDDSTWPMSPVFRATGSENMSSKPICNGKKKKNFLLYLHTIVSEIVTKLKCNVDK